MLTIFDADVTRREWLRIGSIGLGALTLPSLLAARSKQPERAKARSVIIFGLLGGPPQHETWDPKPDAPAEIRGEFGTIPTSIPGFRVGELMPKTAKLAHKIAVLRAVSSGDNAHSSSGYQMLTGVEHEPRNRENVTAQAPNLAPSLTAIMRYLRHTVNGLPSAVVLPEHLWNDGNIPWPGQDAGILGRKYNPWLIHCDPNQPNFQAPEISPRTELNEIRLKGRQSLLSELNVVLDREAENYEKREKNLFRDKAFDLVSSQKARKAFAIEEESPATRDRYGRTRFGQSVLLARRLVEAGVPMIQVNWTRIKDAPNQGMWDTHRDHAKSLRSPLMPMMDHSFSALIEDLDQRGLLDSTLVLWTGEFGRTPKINGSAGRDHWGNVFSLALAGGGISGGVVHGSSDAQAAYPRDGRVTPKDIIATVFDRLGYSPETELLDHLDRPIPLTRGEVIKAITTH